MKIIHIMDNLNTAGGVNSFVYDLCLALKSAGQDVALVAVLGDPKRSKFQAASMRNAGVPVYCLDMPSKKTAILRGIPKLRKTIQKIAGSAPTVCNLHLKLSVLMGTMATVGMRNMQCVETYHSNYSHYWLQNKLLSSRVAKYICCSASARDEFGKRFHPRQEKVCEIANGVDREVLQALASLDEIKAEKDRKVFLGVGRLSYEKNFCIAAQAFSELDAGTAVYRQIGSGPEMDAIEKIAKTSSAIELIGSVSRSHVLAAVKCADMVVMPSLWEGLSIFMLEAMAMARPLMLSDIPSFRNVVKEPALTEEERWRVCSWGYLVGTSDVDAYRAAVRHFIAHPELASAMQDRIREIFKDYDMKEVVRCYIKVYREVLHIS